MGSVTLVVLTVIVFVFLACAQAGYGSDRTIVFYRIGEGNAAAWAYLKHYFEANGFGVTTVEGEAETEKHVEKINRINRGRYDILIALQLMEGERGSAMVAKTLARKVEGRFLTIEEVPVQFSSESEKLAGSVEASFKTKVRHLPLFPLLGVNGPGIFVRIECKPEEVNSRIEKLYTGVDRYFSERMNGK